MGNIFDGRAQYKDMSEQERIEQMKVSMGNAPAASAVSPDKVTYQQVPTVQMPNETSQDNKCPSCGGTLSFDPATGGLICNFCGSHVAINTVNAAPDVGYTIEELQHNGGRRLQYGMKHVVCGTCGGSFISETSSMSGLCPYCGSNSITESGNAAGALEPTGIVPFKISKDQAQSIFKQWISARRMAPMDIAKNAQITDLVGVYVPYWVFDCDTYTPYSGKFGKTYGSGDDSYTKYHKSSGVCQMPVKNLTLMASGRLANDHFWKSVSKFDFTSIKNFEANLLSGFWSESYTVDGVTRRLTLVGEEAWHDFLNRMFALAEEGHEVSFRNEEAASRIFSAKDSVTYTTKDRDKAYAWADAMIAGGYTVTVTFDKTTGYYTCYAIE